MLDLCLPLDPFALFCSKTSPGLVGLTLSVAPAAGWQNQSEPAAPVEPVGGACSPSPLL